MVEPRGPDPDVFSLFTADDDIVVGPLACFFVVERFFSGGPSWFRVGKAFPTAPTAEPEDA